MDIAFKSKFQPIRLVILGGFKVLMCSAETTDGASPKLGTALSETQSEEFKFTI